MKIKSVSLRAYTCRPTGCSETQTKRDSHIDLGFFNINRTGWNHSSISIISTMYRTKFRIFVYVSIDLVKCSDYIMTNEYLFLLCLIFLFLVCRPVYSNTCLHLKELFWNDSKRTTQLSLRIIFSKSLLIEIKKI